MARSEIVTLLPLDRYAKIMGISPAHFNQASAPTLSPAVFPISGTCSDVWFQHAWQKFDRVSREDLARVIHDAEEDIRRELGYSVAPQWVANEIHQYPRHHRRQVFTNGRNVRGMLKSIKLRSGRFIQAGRRAVTLVGTATVGGGTLVFTDPDGDGLSELATITLPTTLTDVCELNLYFVGENGAQEWEIRPTLTKVIAGGSVTITVESWKLIDPDLWEQFPNADGEPNSIDISTTANFVTSVDIYREFTDFTQVSAEFFWERLPQNDINSVLCGSCGGTGCIQCTLITQDGCIHVRDVRTGTIAGGAATFNTTTGNWEGQSWIECREPDQIKVWYFAGELDERFLRDETCERLSIYWAQTISWLATARLERPFCACANVQALANNLMVDLSKSGGEESFFVDTDLLGNPFGTKRGEIMAWQRVSKFGNKLFTGTVI